MPRAPYACGKPGWPPSQQDLRATGLLGFGVWGGRNPGRCYDATGELCELPRHVASLVCVPGWTHVVVGSDVWWRAAPDTAEAGPKRHGSTSRRTESRGAVMALNRGALHRRELKAQGGLRLSRRRLCTDGFRKGRVTGSLVLIGMNSGAAKHQLTQARSAQGPCCEGQDLPSVLYRQQPPTVHVSHRHPCGNAQRGGWRGCGDRRRCSWAGLTGYTTGAWLQRQASVVKTTMARAGREC